MLFKNLKVTGDFPLPSNGTRVPLRSDITNAVFTGNVNGIDNQGGSLNGGVQFLKTPMHNIGDVEDVVELNKVPMEMSHRGGGAGKGALYFRGLPPDHPDLTGKIGVPETFYSAYFISEEQGNEILFDIQQNPGFGIKKAYNKGSHNFPTYEEIETATNTESPTLKAK